MLYANLSRKHLEPAPFGAIRLDKLKASDIDALLLAMRLKTKAGMFRNFPSSSTCQLFRVTVARSGH